MPTLPHPCPLANITTRNLFMHHRILRGPDQPRSPFDGVNGVGALRSASLLTVEILNLPHSDPFREDGGFFPLVGRRAPV